MDTINTRWFSIPISTDVEGKKFTKGPSVYDMTAPVFSDNNETIANLISRERENKCKDYESLPDTAITAKKDGNRVLMINKFSFSGYLQSGILKEK